MDSVSRRRLPAGNYSPTTTDCFGRGSQFWAAVLVNRRRALQAWRRG